MANNFDDDDGDDGNIDNDDYLGMIMKKMMIIVKMTIMIRGNQPLPADC